MAIFYIYGIDVTIKSVLKKGNFDQMRLEVENLSKSSEVYLSTKDYNSYSRLFNGKVHHLFSRFFNLPDSNIGKILTSAIFFSFGFISIMKRAKKIDAIVVQGTASLHGAIANVLLHKPVVLYLQYFAYNEQALLRRSFLSIVFRWMEFFSIRHCNVVIAPNERLQAEALATGAKSVKIIPNFVSLSEIGKIGGKGVLRDKLGINRNVSMILFVGRLHPVKNVGLILRSFSSLGELDNAILVVVGDGPEKQRLIDLASNLGITDRVRFVGFQPKTTVLEYMKAADVLVLPSKVEGQPRVILEAWACDLPVVASNVRGIKNLVTNGFDGLLFDLPSEKHFAQAISKALESEVANELRRNARKQLSRYSEDSVLFQQAMVVRKFLLKSSVG